MEAAPLTVVRRCRHLPPPLARLLLPPWGELSSRWVVCGGELAEERKICTGAGDSPEGEPESSLATADDCTVKGAGKGWFCALTLAGEGGGGRTHLVDHAPLLRRSITPTRKNQEAAVGGPYVSTLALGGIALLVRRCTPNVMKTSVQTASATIKLAVPAPIAVPARDETDHVYTAGHLHRVLLL